MKQSKAWTMFIYFVSIVMIIASTSFVGCYVDLEPETLEFMKEVQGDCLELEDDLTELILQTTLLNEEIQYLYSVLEYYGWYPSN